LHTNRSGFQSEQIGRPRWLIFKKKPKLNKCYYNVSGTLEWRLLGLKVYSEPKDFEGEMELKNKAIC
jgi:hypothetical protein